MSTRLAQLSQLLAQSPQDPFLLFAIAKEHEKLGDVAEALRHYELLRTANPDYVGLYYHLGKLQMRTNPDAAAETYREGIAIAQKMGDFHALAELKGALLELED